MILAAEILTITYRPNSIAVVLLLILSAQPANMPSEEFSMWISKNIHIKCILVTILEDSDT